MLEAAEAFPVNLGFMGKGNASNPDALREQVGWLGHKLHEDGAPRVRLMLFNCGRTRCSGRNSPDLNESGFVKPPLMPLKIE